MKSAEAINVFLVFAADLLLLANLRLFLARELAWSALYDPEGGELLTIRFESIMARQWCR